MQLKCWPGALCRIVAPADDVLRDRFVTVDRLVIDANASCNLCGHIDHGWHLRGEPLHVDRITPDAVERWAIHALYDCVLVPLKGDVDGTADESHKYLPDVPRVQGRETDDTKVLSI